MCEWIDTFVVYSCELVSLPSGCELVMMGVGLWVAVTFIMLSLRTFLLGGIVSRASDL